MLLRVFLWLLFTAICMGGIIFVSVLLAFVAVASGMVALDAAQNIRRCAVNSATIPDLLNRQVKRCIHKKGCILRMQPFFVKLPLSGTKSAHRLRWR